MAYVGFHYWKATNIWTMIIYEDTKAPFPLGIRKLKEGMERVCVCVENTAFGIIWNISGNYGELENIVTSM